MNLIERAGRRLVEAPGRGAEQAPDTPGRIAKIQEAVFGKGRDDIIARGEGDAPARSAPGRKRQTERQIELDFQGLRGMGYTAPSDQSALAEEFRLIKRPLLDAAFSRSPDRPANANLIMVTSVGPNEGKTFTAVNLALSMALEHDTRVLLIDADVVKPSIPHVLGFEADKGLINVIGDSSIDLADVLIRCDVENLTLLPAGTPTGFSSELLTSLKMARFVDDIAKRYTDRIIIFDSPPVLARSEPTMLARHVGQILFVVEAERTSKSAIKDALLLLDPKLVKFVMNKAPAALLRGGFGQYYYQYKGQDRK